MYPNPRPSCAVHIRAAPSPILLEKHMIITQPFILIFRNELEREFLRLLQFNTNVPQSVFVKYYFDLRTLAEANDLAYPPEPLTKDRALKLEAMSQSYDDKVTQEIIQNSIRRWSSVDKLFVNRRNPTILS